MSIARSDLAAVIYDALDGAAELILDDTVRGAWWTTGIGCGSTFESGRARDFDLVVGADGLHSRVRRLAFGPDEPFEKYLGIVVAAFEAEGYRPRDELIAMMHAEVGFQAVRLSLPRRPHAVPVQRSPRRPGARSMTGPRSRHCCGTDSPVPGWETPAIMDLMPRAKTFYFDAVSQIRMPSWTRGRCGLGG